MLFDSHTHVFASDLPLRPTRRYAPTTTAAPDALSRTLDSHGVYGALLVQPSFLHDHHYVFDAAAGLRHRFRVVVSPASLEELDAGWAGWCENGAVGVRLNLVGGEIPDLGSRSWRAVMRRLADTAMHLEVQAQGDQWGALMPAMVDAPCDVVIDHLGRTTDSDVIARLGVMKHIWIKASAPYRWPDLGQGLALVTRLFDETGGERLLWGSDWPFTQHEDETSYGEVLEFAHREMPGLERVSDENLQRLLGPRRFITPS